MNWASSEAVNLLTFLVPGFAAAAVFYSLTSHPAPRAFDRVIHALIFTIIGKIVWDALFSEDKPWEFAQTVAITVALAFVFVWISNNDVAYWLLRRLRFTRETSHPSEWYSAFSRHGDCYVVLHLTGQRRLYGWPEEWPGDPERGHFRITEAEWLRDEQPGVDTSRARDPHTSGEAGLPKRQRPAYPAFWSPQGRWEWSNFSRWRPPRPGRRSASSAS